MKALAFLALFVIANQALGDGNATPISQACIDASKAQLAYDSCMAKVNSNTNVVGEVGLPMNCTLPPENPCSKFLPPPNSDPDPTVVKGSLVHGEAINPKLPTTSPSKSPPAQTAKSGGPTGSPDSSKSSKSGGSSSGENIQDDIDACNSALSSGQSTCNQGQGGSVSGTNGMYANAAGAQSLNNAAGNCAYAAQSCKNACGGAANSWQSNCSGSNCDSTTRNGIDTLYSLNNACNNLSSQAQNMANQANQAMNDAANALNDQNNMQPQSTPSASSAVDCTNPVARASSPDQCGVAPSPAAQAANDQAQKPGYPTDNPGTGGSNVDGSAPKQDSVFPPLNNPADNSRPSTPQMPMAMQGGIMPDSGNANQGGRVSAQPGYYQRPADTNVVKGDRAGGGGASMPVGIPPDEKTERRLASVGGGAGLPGFTPEDLSRMRGLDLKRYLPGGDRYATGRMGGVSPRHPELYTSDVNLFQVISARFQAHCKLEPLYDCH